MLPLETPGRLLPWLSQLLRVAGRPGVPELAMVLLESLPLWSHGVCPPPLSVCVQSPLFLQGHGSCWIRAHCHVDLLTSAKALFPNKVTGTGGEDCTLFSWRGIQFTPQLHPLAKPSNLGTGDPRHPWKQPLSLSLPCLERHSPYLIYPNTAPRRACC